MNLTDDKNWQPLSLDEVNNLLESITIPWWLAGGNALDLFIGKQTREHLDLDILILRKDQFIMKEYLTEWLFYKTNQPGLLPWNNSEFLDIGINSVWCKRNEKSPWNMEIIFMDSDDQEWFYRRNPKIRGPLENIGLIKNNISIISPEIQLLFKSKYHSKAKNSFDFQNTLSYLSSEQKEWLKKSLEIEYKKEHPWIEQL